MKLPYQSAFAKYLPLALLILIIAFASRASCQEYEHKFLDKRGVISIAVSGGLIATDTAITCNYLSTGRWFEHQLPVKHCAGIATWLGASYASQVGTAYYFHQTGHHRLERLTEMLWAGDSVFGITWNLTHRPWKK